VLKKEIQVIPEYRSPPVLKEILGGHGELQEATGAKGDTGDYGATRSKPVLKEILVTRELQGANRC